MDRPHNPSNDAQATGADQTTPQTPGFSDAEAFGIVRDRFEAFYRENHSAALRFASSRSSVNEAEAIVADSFLMAWGHFLNGHELTRAWLYGIVRNKLGDLYRSSRRAHEIVSEDLPEVPTVESTTTTELKIVVQKALKCLPANYSEILALAYWSDLPPAEAAKIIGISHVNYRVRLLRAQRALAKHVNDLKNERR